MNGYVQIDNCVVLFYFLGKLKVWMDGWSLNRGVMSVSWCAVNRRSIRCHRRIGSSSLVCVFELGGGGECVQGVAGRFLI